MIDFPSQNPNVRIIKNILIKFTVLSFFVVLFSCGEDPMFVGRNLLPPSDNILIKADTSTSVIAYTATAKPIITTSNEQYLLGSLNDPVFGYSEASIITQIDPASPRTLPQNRVIDSLVIQLRIKDFFGDSLSPQTLKIYDIKEDIRTDTVYYSNADPVEFSDPEELASADYFPNDSIITMHINHPAYLQKFAAAIDTVFSKTQYFREVFKGFYIKTEKQYESGGAITYLNLSSTETTMVLYYDTVKVENDSSNYAFQMYLGYYSNAFNIFNSNYESYPPASGLNNPENQDTILFATSMAGLDIRIRLPDLEKWQDKVPVSIIKAELIIGVEDSAYQWKDHTLYPQRFFLYSLDSENNYQILYDYNLSSDIFGGYYDTTEKVYKINISYYLQSFIDKKIGKTELVLITSSNNSTANRVLIKSPLSKSKSRMQLKVIYTEI